MLATEIKQMPVDKRIVLMEQIWDTLCEEKYEIESPSWHEQILRQRIDSINSGKATFISIKELKDINT